MIKRNICWGGGKTAFQVPKGPCTGFCFFDLKKCRIMPLLWQLQGIRLQKVMTWSPSSGSLTLALLCGPSHLFLFWSEALWHLLLITSPQSLGLLCPGTPSGGALTSQKSLTHENSLALSSWSTASQPWVPVQE